MEDANEEISQISLFLAVPDATDATLFDSEKVAEFETIFQKEDFVVDGVQCTFLYFEPENQKRNPKWLDFINSKLKKSYKFSAKSKNPNGILKLHIKDRYFIATFGRTSTSLINKKIIVRDFGIKTAMNMCGNNEILQTKSQSNTIATTFIDRQTNKPTDSFIFGLSDSEYLKYISA